MEPITDHKSLIDALGGNTVVANGIADCTAVRVGQWKIGNRIPPEYWPRIIELAAKAGYPDVTSDWLMNTLRPRATPSADTSESEAA